MEIKNSSSSKVLLTMAALVVILAGVKAASSILVPFLLSVFIAMACNPLITWASRYRVPRWLSVILVILLIVIFGFMLAGLVGNSMNEFSRNLPEYKEQLAGELNWLVSQLAALNIHLDRTQLLSYLDPGLAMNMASNLLSGVGAVMTNFLLILLTVVFMLFEAESVPRKVHIALADPAMKIQQIDKFLSSIKDYLAIKTLVSLATGFLAGLMLYLLGVDHFMLWAVLAFLLNYIPNIGSIIAAVPAVLLALVQLGPATAGLVALGYVMINTLMGNVIEPRFMGRGLGLSTLVVFLSLIFWGWLLGTVGMLLSVPLTMIVKIALESTQGGRWFALLLADDVKAKENAS
ncbi:AI-2E family transporter [Bowmanella sp. Y26]|uniref:AI-2E family transporter n=1 Tax=Bowmanella yangjiangensis TaxID=2811230 RepID=A0ABS3CWB3_9ALTE|nr:AI-2E family transporter [Bowmanella yangjiangensis]MBN7819909.1 AI-2E family transporter [Bowmanella yangjiangensis]MBT1063242.1 AI-2E family transporter [Bowmanella yangjiangensis]